jgi:hypothetical protein
VVLGAKPKSEPFGGDGNRTKLGADASGDSLLGGPVFGKEASLDALQFSLLGACFGEEASLDAFGAALQF